MKFRTYGDPTLPAILLIHGATWAGAYLLQAERLQHRYHVILPILDGHGGEPTIYASSERSADDLLAYIDERHAGKIFALCGVSLGGQIVAELLSRRERIADFAITDGSCWIPQPQMLRYARPLLPLHWALERTGLPGRLGNRGIAPEHRMPEPMLRLYLQQIKTFRRRTSLAIFDSYFAYALKDSIRNCKTRVLCFYAGKEHKAIRESARLLCSLVPRSECAELPGYVHGELSVHRPDEWIERAEDFWSASEIAL
ncbi:alpha/beta hydrolase [Saccharibacillus sacchari]|uniref:Alpha/beta hydrolase n=1 Tax=Saccharibacillus sacchari TaxID=456493 RepID=A0ACC6P9J2_9BACL